MNEHATATINMKGCTLMIDCRGTRAKEEKEEKKEREKRKEKKDERNKCPRKYITHNLRFNYYHMQSQYKSVIQFVQQYKYLYAKFEAYSRRNEDLIRHSVLFNPENSL